MNAKAQARKESLIVGLEEIRGKLLETAACLSPPQQEVNNLIPPL